MTRIFDIIISLISLLILSPLFIVIAIMIKIDSTGPMIFSQLRVGRYGKEFSLYKFRSMRMRNISSDSQLTIGNDTRITGVGAFLRKYKLDELPQLLNVLFGEMSMVGPRPEVKRYIDLYNKDQLEVLKVRPGITDMASIVYSNENEILSKQVDPERYYIEYIMPEKIRLNKVFISSPSAYNYFRIIFLTIGKLLRS